MSLFFREMNEDSLKTGIVHKESTPRPLLECLDVQSTFQKRKKTKIFERIDSSKEIWLLLYKNKIYFY